MPRREIGLMGYVGEAVVSCWLKRGFPAPEFAVVTQIRPKKVPAKGGPYLDLAVVRGDTVHAVFEVKSQDYIWGGDSEVNLSLDYIWSHRGQVVDYVLQNARTFTGDPGTQAYLVLLVPPNADGIKAIGRTNLQNVLLFEDLWRTPEAAYISEETILEELREDVNKVFAILREPTQGSTLKQPFLAARPPSSCRDSLLWLEDVMQY